MKIEVENATSACKMLHVLYTPAVAFCKPLPRFFFHLKCKIDLETPVFDRKCQHPVPHSKDLHPLQTTVTPSAEQHYAKTKKSACSDKPAGQHPNKHYPFGHRGSRCRTERRVKLANMAVDVCWQPTHNRTT